MRSAPSALFVGLLLSSLAALTPGCKDEKTRLPFVVAETPSQVVTGPTPVFFTLIQQTRTPTTVVADYSADNGVSFFRATPAPGQPNQQILLSRPEGERFNFFWDPLSDLGPGLHRDVIVRVFGFGEGSVPTDTAPIVVDLTDRLVKDSSLTGLVADEATGAVFADGSVLIAGGRDASGSLSAQAYRYQPHLDRVDVVAGLSTPRTAVASGRLVGGGILCVGGTESGGASSAVDLLSVSAGSGQRSSPTTGLATARSFATVVPLSDGRALILGGNDGSGNVVSAVELYTPNSSGGTIQAAYTSALAARTGATATRLGDGRVVILGGSNGGTARQDAAIVSGAAQTSLVAAGQLQVGRSQHGAVLLPDGRIFVAGGTNTLGSDAGALSNAEIYDPVSQSSLSVASMGRARRRPGLAYVDGAVIAVGGTGANDSATTVERYELSSNTWVDIADPTGTSRPAPAAVAYGPGFVLVAGGQAGAERYLADADVVTSSFELLESIPQPRADHTATLDSQGNVLVVGGTSQVSSATTSVQLFDTFADTFSDKASLLTARAGHAATLLPDTRILVAGGANENGLVAQAEVYSTASDRWEAAGTLAIPRRDAVLTVFGVPNFPRVLILGGTDGNGNPVAEIEEWNPVSQTFSTIGSLPEGRTDFEVAATFSNFAIGPGTGQSGAQSTVVNLDPFQNLASSSLSLASARTGASVTFSSGSRRVLVSGGQSGTTLHQDAELLDLDRPDRLVFSNRPTMIVARRQHRSAYLVETNRAVIVGGIGSSGLPQDEGEVFSFTNLFDTSISSGIQGSFGRTADRTMNRARHRHTATSLFDGRVLIVGGVDERGAAIPGGELFVP